MGLFISIISRLQSTGRIVQGVINGQSRQQSSHAVSIHILNDDSLLHVFYLYRPFLFGEDQDDGAFVFGGDGKWASGHWWYKLTHVCRRWRNVILGSASHLGLFLVCTNGIPVADMLAHSPPFPLIINYHLDKYHDFTAKDEEASILALNERGRVRRIYLRMPVTNLQRLIVAIEEEYPILEFLAITHRIADSSTAMMLPETFQAPHLRHLVLKGFALPMGSRLRTAVMGLVTLYLTMIQPSTYFHLNTLPQWLSSTPQLETLVILFSRPVPNRDVERQLPHTLTMTAITLPNLRHFRFQGISTYLETLVHQITTPRLEKLDIYFFNKPTFSVPRLLQFMNRTDNLRFENAKIEFSRGRVYVKVYLREAETHALSISVGCWHLDWQVSSMAQISNSLSQMFSAVVHLTLGHEVHSLSLEEHNDVGRIEWRNLLRSFCNVKTLRIEKGLVEEISRCLELDDGELPLEMLPELQELSHFGRGSISDAFTSFIDARQNAGRPINLVRSSPSPDYFESGLVLAGG